MSDHCINYYFISSPLHLLVAANLSLSMPATKQVALIIANNVEQAKRYAAALASVPELFDEVEVLSHAEKHGLLGKISARKASLKRLKQIFSTPLKKQLFAGNDRRMEFQYAMHCSKAGLADTRGIYMDDGAVSYLGHKSMGGFAHENLDPMLRKLVYGKWWQHVATTGSSAWVSEAYLAFPKFAHPLLKSKAIKAIDASVFIAKPIQQLSQSMLASSGVDTNSLADFKLFLVLPNEGVYKHDANRLTVIFERLCLNYDVSEICIKAHPRSQDDALLIQAFPGVTFINKQLGMEMLLPLLNPNCVILGELSTALLSSKWLRPDLPVFALASDKPDTSLDALFDRLSIKHATFSDGCPFQLACSV